MSDASWRSLGCGLLAVIGYLSAACGPPVPAPNQIAQIEDEAISHQDFEEFLGRNAIEGAGALGSDVLSSLLDQFLEEALLVRLASDRLGWSAPIDASSAARALVEAQGPTIDNAAVAEYYRSHSSEFQQTPTIHLRQMLFSARETATRIRARWQAGVPYESLREELAADPSAHVGEEGPFTREELPAVFAEILFSLEQGEVSEVVPVEYGFHVFQVVRHERGGTMPLELVADEIRQSLLVRRRQEVLERLVAEARERYNVLVFGRNLPFNYRGRFAASNRHESAL